MNDTEQKLNHEEPVCLLCGGPVDTGWECTECGFDSAPWYCPEGFKAVPEEGTRSAEAPREKP